jgi:hypothetical protein
MTLYQLNGSHIVIVPKKKDVILLIEFRPISIVHAVQRIFFNNHDSKNTTLHEGHNTTDPTGFIKGRNIFEGLHYA